jgi:hypothetical protein
MIKGLPLGVGLRMVCMVCGAIGADARPNWNERASAWLLGERQ